MISKAFIFVQRVIVLITGHGSTHLLKHILIAVIVGVRKRNGVAFLQVAESTSHGYVDKVFSFLVEIHYVWH